MHIRIEEQNRLRDENGSAKELHSKANLIRDNTIPIRKIKTKTTLLKRRVIALYVGNLDTLPLNASIKHRRKKTTKRLPRLILLKEKMRSLLLLLSLK